MGTVDLDDGLDDTLFHLLHAVQLFVQDPSGLFRVNGFKIVILPLDIHHSGQGSLGVAALLWGNLIGTGYR